MLPQLVQHAAQHPFWLVKMAPIYLGNPVVFFSYGALAKVVSPVLSPVIKIKLDSLFTQVCTNVHKITSFPAYVAVTLPFYVAWLFAQVALWTKVFPGFCTTHFLAQQASLGSLLSAVPGLVNLYVFCTEGMEGNVFGFIFALPMFIATCCNFCIWGWSIENSLPFGGKGPQLPI